MDEEEGGKNESVAAGAKWACGMIAPWVQEMTIQTHEAISPNRAIMTCNSQEMGSSTQTVIAKSKAS